MAAGMRTESGSLKGKDGRNAGASLLIWEQSKNDPRGELRACLKVSCLSDAVENKACCGDFDECLRALHAVLVIFAQSSIAAKPGEAALHNPCEACDLERALPAFDDLQLPALAQQVVRELATLVSGISNDCANVREQWPQAAEQP